MTKKTATRLLAIAAVLTSTLAISHTADAGGFLRSRIRILTPRQRTTNRANTWTRTSSRTVQTPYRKSTTTNSNKWPGAIGAPSHRYQFFQDANGYWN